MQILMYAQDGGSTDIAEVIGRIAPGMELFTTTQGLSNRLRHPSGEATIAVLIVKTGEDLIYLRQIRHLLQDVRIILILPDRKAETVAAGHTLQPRFLGYLDDDTEEIAAVLKKMLNVSRGSDGR